MTPSVSFVVLSYNYGSYIGDCVQSILSQEGGFDFEIVVVDDASTDNSQDIIQQFKDPRIRFFGHVANQGHIATVTDGLRQARGEFIARIDSDDRYRPNFLKEVLPVFRKYSDVDLVYGDAAIIDAAGVRTQTTADREHPRGDFKGNEFVALLKRNFICSPTVIARRHAWLKTLPIPPGLAFHDWYFTLMMARTNDFYYRNEVLADYRVHAHNWHTKIAREKAEEFSIFKLLDSVYGQTEENAGLEQAKRRCRKAVYGAHYRDLAEKYFGFGMNEDARRCYLRALALVPTNLFDLGLLRRLAATHLKRKDYESLKWIFSSRKSSP